MADRCFSSPYDDFNTNLGVKYYYWVKASCALGDSAFSNSDIGWRLPPRRNLGAAAASDWAQIWQNDVVNFAETLTASQGWNQWFVNGMPDRTWWQEESSGGQDSAKADYCELSIDDTRVG